VRTKNSTPEIDVMTNAVFEPPVHPSKQAKCFEVVGEYDSHQTSRTYYL